MSIYRFRPPATVNLYTSGAGENETIDTNPLLPPSTSPAPLPPTTDVPEASLPVTGPATEEQPSSSSLLDSLPVWAWAFIGGGVLVVVVGGGALAFVCCCRRRGHEDAKGDSFIGGRDLEAAATFASDKFSAKSPPRAVYGTPSYLAEMGNGSLSPTNLSTARSVGSASPSSQV